MPVEGIESFKQLEPNDVIKDLTAYIESALPGFPASKEFANVLSKKKNENQHSSAFCIYMTCKCSSNYYFERESSQKGSSTVDIGIYVGGILIYTIEAKVLPTPKGSRKKPRAEHEYVYGKQAAIQRFKDEHHGLDHLNNLLPESGLVAFIKEKDFNHWFKKVNQWVDDASWDRAEKLNIIYIHTVARLVSKHTRIGKSEILLNHFWTYV